MSLGYWQLDRAAYKAAIVDKFESRMAGLPQKLNPDDDVSDIEFRPLILEGEYDLEHSFYLDNQLHRGIAGYNILTPFRLANDDRILLIDRGWVALGASREQLPEAKVPLVQGTATGIASFPESIGYRMGEINLSGQWPEVIPFIDPEALQAQFSPALMPFVLRLSPDQEGHYIRAWKPVWALPEKSRAYAVQWFSFAGLALALFFILNLRKLK